ncbi:transporter [Hydrogenophaga sp.]|uniref:SphA family protein n=1 Tax=Hydrogenophaga sp. TaxID=1904254 RepID=UPI0027314842|nr:transporter [Hydrogenophaga sp.]MDP2072799.1 transporter [Hydrogenophaga sp.]MDP3108586.1 transporter [Hydrogenophaga sp.]MDZ4399784.1 transporter [Hydrogenophaga sp.]
MNLLRSAAPWISAFALLGAGTVQATEGGGSTYNPGVENFLVGAAPPPGFYVLEYLTHYRANKVMDSNGNVATPPDFKLRATAAATRFVWSTPTQVAGGNLVMHAIVPLVNLKVSVGAFSQSKTGLGDITFGPGIAYHHSPALHSVVGLDFVAPTGRYKSTDPVNIGRNYWSLQPLYTMSYINPNGFNGDFKATLNINGKNSATQYKSGDEFILDYSAGYGLGNGWVVGVGGYVYEQLNDDKQNGASLANSKASSFAIGPSLKYDNGKGWFITAKLQKESNAKNRPEGTALWIKTMIPF